MTDPRPSLAEHQLTVIRAFLRQRVPLFELIDRFDDEANAHRFTPRFGDRLWRVLWRIRNWLTRGR